MTHSSAFKSLLSYLLVASFLLTPISSVLAVVEGSTDSNPSPAPSSTSWWWENNDTSDNSDDSSSDSDSESEAEKDKRQADATASEIREAASAAGVSLTVGSVYESEPSGSEVSIDGVELSKESALAAISAMGAAKDVGALGVVDTNKTIAAYANGSACAGCVVGSNTGVTGAPSEVAKAEAEYMINVAGVVGARLVDGIANAVAIKAPNLSSVLSSIAPKILPTADTSKTNVLPPSVIAQYQEMGRGLQSAGVSNLSGTQIEKGYLYNNETGLLVGITTGKTYEVSNVGLASKAPQIASTNPNSTIKIDTTSGFISATNVTTGIVQSYDLEGKALISNYDIEAGFSWDGTAYGQYLLINDGAGDYKVINATNGTPSSQIASGQFDLGSVPSEVNALSQRYGYTIDSPEELVALALSGELSPATRNAIVKAYKEDPSFSTLNLSSISEVGGILGSFAGEAYRRDNSFSEQLMVDRYVTSITWDPKNNKESAFDRYKYDGPAMLAFAEAYTSGQLTNKYGLKVTAPVEVANHTFASTVDPENRNLTAEQRAGIPSWIYQMDDTSTVGGRHYTKVGYITSELNNSSNWRGLMVDQDFTYDAETYGPLSNAKEMYTLVSLIPSSNIGVVDLGNDSGVSLKDLRGNYSYSTGNNSPVSSEPSASNSTEQNFQPISITPAPSSGCSDCVKIESAVCKIASSCTIDSDYAVRLDFLVQNSDLPFRVTEGFPPTVKHANSCHSNGTCTDIGFTGIAYTSETVNQFISDAEKAGLRAVFESVTPAGCAGIENCQVIPWATASHFSLYMGENAPNFSTANNSGAPTKETPVQTDSGGWLSGAFNAGKDAVLKATEGVVSGEVVKEIDKVVNNPFFQFYAWAVGTFGGSGGGSLNPNPDSNNSSSGGSNNIPPCPAKPGDPDPYRDWRIQNGYPPCPDTATPSANNQAGAAFLPFLDSNFIQYLFSIFGWINSKDSSPAIDNPLITEPDTALVKITIDDTNKVVALSRPDLEVLIANQSIDINERAILLKKLEETPVVFDETGKMIYSNGVYTPPIENGREIASNQTYSYIIEYVDAQGKVIPTETSSTNVSNDLLTDALRSFLGENKPFTLSNLEDITYYLVNPDQSIPNDEYYVYTVKTADGLLRSVDIPQFTSVNNMKERFQKIGFSGDVLALTALAIEKQPERRALDKVTDFASELFGKFVDTLNGNSSTPSIDTSTVLPEISTELDANDIKAVNIYPNSTLVCPDLPELSQGFMYTVVLTDPANTQKYINITDGRCGSNDPLLMAAETARHLQVHYGVSDVTYDSIANKTSFRTEAAAFIPGVTSMVIGSTSSAETSPTLPEDNETPETTPTSTPSQLPNLTNTIVFEVKAVGSDGKILADWVDTEKITISPTVQLHFRWKANDYQQCLPFLNDNGNYSLTRSNRAMITGDTELENYSVTERSGVYRLECGGQRNNEFGVDAREIEVTVQ